MELLCWKIPTYTQIHTHTKVNLSVYLYMKNHKFIYILYHCGCAEAGCGFYVKYTCINHFETTYICELVGAGWSWFMITVIIKEYHPKKERFTENQILIHHNAFFCFRFMLSSSLLLKWCALDFVRSYFLNVISYNDSLAPFLSISLFVSRWKAVLFLNMNSRFVCFLGW